jgi:hypothetical protein
MRTLAYATLRGMAILGLGQRMAEMGAIHMRAEAAGRSGAC